MKLFKIVVFAFFFFNSAICFNVAYMAANASDDQSFPIASAPESRFEHHPAVLEGEEVSHDYIIQNKGTAELIIEKVKTG